MIRAPITALLGVIMAKLTEEENKEKERAYQHEYFQKRYKTDPEFRRKRIAYGLTYYLSAEKKRLATDPEYRERKNKKSREERRERSKDPEYRERLNKKKRERYKTDPEIEKD